MCTYCWHLQRNNVWMCDVLRVARVDSGWGVRERSEPFFPWFSKEKKACLLLLRVPLLLLLLLLLHYVLLVGPARCFVFGLTLPRKLYCWWMLYRTLRKVRCTNMTKEHVRSYGVYCGIMYGCVRSIGVYSGLMYGCVRYVLRIARVDSGWGGRERSV